MLVKAYGDQMTDLIPSAGFYANSVHENLSHTEKSFITWSLQGKSHTEISEALGLSDITLKLYAESICKKLSARSFAAATAKAVEFGLVEP